eukprot:TRINITY_DN4062_c0_g4_i1.p1 TRINITY_DN4062_c0_g4~~TRINITY_DN4062_c0_g4_i1.p1  ORF type:complete len:472 (-),score=78.30 TRINITY_DN4062_c0_g4_i1:383-1738(-)
MCIRDSYTANQILDHPWITRKLDDEIPLTINERMGVEFISQKIMRMFKLVGFLKSLTRNQWKNSSSLQRYGSKVDLAQKRLERSRERRKLHGQAPSIMILANPSDDSATDKPFSNEDLETIGQIKSENTTPTNLETGTQSCNQSFQLNSREGSISPIRGRADSANRRVLLQASRLMSKSRLESADRKVLTPQDLNPPGRVWKVSGITVSTKGGQPRSSTSSTAPPHLKPVNYHDSSLMSSTPNNPFDDINNKSNVNNIRKYFSRNALENVNKGLSPPTSLSPTLRIERRAVKATTRIELIDKDSIANNSSLPASNAGFTDHLQTNQKGFNIKPILVGASRTRTPSRLLRQATEVQEDNSMITTKLDHSILRSNSRQKKKSNSVSYTYERAQSLPSNTLADKLPEHTLDRSPGIRVNDNQRPKGIRIAGEYLKTKDFKQRNNELLPPLFVKR